MKNINWKLRLHSGAFWTGLIGAVIFLLKNSFGIQIDDGVVNAITNIALLVLTSVGLVVDPTTKGLTDSTQAMGYTKPKQEDKK